MAKLYRLMLISYADNETPIQVLVPKLDLYQCLPSGETHLGGQEAGTDGRVSFKLPAGAVYGFLASQQVTITHSDPNSIVLKTASEKDPWPPPPPPPLTFPDAANWSERYRAFLKFGAAQKKPDLLVEITVRPT